MLREVLGDDPMTGHQHFSFEMTVNEESGEHEFGPSNSGYSAALFQLVSVSLSVRAGLDCVPDSLCHLWSTSTVASSRTGFLSNQKVYAWMYYSMLSH